MYISWRLLSSTLHLSEQVKSAFSHRCDLTVGRGSIFHWEKRNDDEQR